MTKILHFFRRKGMLALLLGVCTAQPCQALERATLRFVDDVRNAEDLAVLEGTELLLAGQLVGRHDGELGGFYLIDMETRTRTLLAPDFSGDVEGPYDACEGPPPARQFGAHGLSVRPLGHRRFHVLAVNHGGRETVEVFELDLARPTPQMSWQGCVVVPPDMYANAVAHLGDLAFAVTSFGDRSDPDSFQKLGAGEPTGFASRWEPGSGWSRIANSDLKGTNGIAASRDGKTLYLANWGGSSLRLLSAGDGRLIRDVGLPDMRPDNIKLDTDGSLIVAGQAAEASEVLACGGRRPAACILPYRVVRIDPKGESARTIFEMMAPESFGAASVAVPARGRLWMGTFQGDRIADAAFAP